MKRVLAVIALLTLAAAAFAWVFMDATTAVFVLVVSMLICICAGMPVLFSVITRRTARASEPHDDAEIIEVNATDRRTE